MDMLFKKLYIIFLSIALIMTICICTLAGYMFFKNENRKIKDPKEAIEILKKYNIKVPTNNIVGIKKEGFNLYMCDSFQLDVYPNRGFSYRNKKNICDIYENILTEEESKKCIQEVFNALNIDEKEKYTMRYFSYDDGIVSAEFFKSKEELVTISYNPVTKEYSLLSIIK